MAAQTRSERERNSEGSISVSYIIYCIFRGPLPAALEIPDGVAGYRVFTANYHGLGAALSKLPESNTLSESANTRAFERVVESFYRHLTVIPMRYGCRVECPYDAVVLLRENLDEYGKLLHHPEGSAGADASDKLFLNRPRPPYNLVNASPPQPQRVLSHRG
jgi:hypothetical protein